MEKKLSHMQSGRAGKSGESEEIVTVTDALLLSALAMVKVKSTFSVALSPLSPQEKMEIANIERVQSIPFPRKGLRGMRTAKEQD